MRFVLLLLLAATSRSFAQPNAAPPINGCGEVITIETHNHTSTRYTLAHALGAGTQDAAITLVLLVGGGGHLDLDDNGCPRALKGNSLVRMRPRAWRGLFAVEGFSCFASRAIA